MSVPTTMAKPTVSEADSSDTARAVDDPAELVAAVAVDAHSVLRLVGRAAEQVDAGRRALERRCAESSWSFGS